jgi:putative endonuclease
MYVGVTNDLGRRVVEHQEGKGGTFTRRYRVHMLVYAEEFQQIEEAIAREKQIKGWSRSKKNLLVEAANPSWANLLEDIAPKDPSLRSG